MDIEIQKTEIIRAQDGDVLAVYIKGYLSEEARAKIKFDLEKAFLPKKITAVVMNAELIELKVMRAE